MNQTSVWVPLVSGGVLAFGLTRRSRAGYAMAAVGGAMLINGARGWASGADRRPYFARGIMVKKTIRVSATPEQCYRFWRNLENLPRFMEHLDSVHTVDDKHSHWRAKLVGGIPAEWDSEITLDRSNEMIGWRSLPGSQVATAGSVRFEPAKVGSGRGTKVRVTLKYNPPGGAVTAAVLDLFGESPQAQIGEELKRFKSIIEASEPRAGSDQLIEITSEDSFPASDPPAWTGASL